MNPNTVYAEHYPLEVRAAVYCRLSKDDDQDGTSASIQNQKELLHRYCEEQGWRVAATFEDDGYTGLNMERPGLKRLLAGVEGGRFDVILTKDLSRLGRNYLQTGQLLEEFFPRNHVRYIALNDAVDTDIENDITPFRNILNEMYSRDVSKKVHSSYLTKAKSGKFTGCLAPFGYRKDPEDKNHLLPDEETAWIVRKIYDYARNGHGPNYIRRRLEDEEIPAPVWWNRKKGLRDKRRKFEIADPEHGRFIWDFTTIKEILSNPVYIGVIASQKVVYRFKVGWLSDKKREDWIAVEVMHEPLIDREPMTLCSRKSRTGKGRTHGAISACLPGLSNADNAAAPLISAPPTPKARKKSSPAPSTTSTAWPIVPSTVSAMTRFPVSFWNRYWNVPEPPLRTSRTQPTSSKKAAGPRKNPSAPQSCKAWRRTRNVSPRWNVS